VMTDSRDNVVNFRVHHRLAAGNRDNGTSEFGKFINPFEHRFNRHGIAHFVVFIAIGAREIAPPHRDDVNENGMLGRSKRFDRVLDSACKAAETTCLWHKLKN